MTANVVTNKVRERRMMLGLSQIQLSFLARVPNVVISGLERGTLTPYPKARKALAAALKIPETELFPDNKVGNITVKRQSKYDLSPLTPIQRLIYAALSNDFIDDSTLLPVIKAALTKREWKVVELRFGLDGKAPQTLEEIGQDFEVTRQRIRQIESEALRKIREKLINRQSLDSIIDAMWSDFHKICSAFHYRDVVALSRALGLSDKTISGWKYCRSKPALPMVLSVIKWGNQGKPMQKMTTNRIGRPPYIAVIEEMNAN